MKEHIDQVKRKLKEAIRQPEKLTRKERLMLIEEALNLIEKFEAKKPKKLH